MLSFLLACKAMVIIAFVYLSCVRYNTFILCICCIRTVCWVVSERIKNEQYNVKNKILIDKQNEQKNSVMRQLNHISNIKRERE